LRKGRDGLPLLTLNTGEERAVRQAAISPSAWRARVANARRAATRRVVIGIETWGDIPALNQAMLLGSRHALPPVLRRVFVDSGTIHVFAISGLHIVLVAAVLSSRWPPAAFRAPTGCWPSGRF
jgi:predicted membrane metal-binding protein